MVEIKGKTISIILIGIAIIGVLLMINFMLYYGNEQYGNGAEALVNMFLSIIVAEVLVIRPLEYAYRFYKKDDVTSLK